MKTGRELIDFRVGVFGGMGTSPVPNPWLPQMQGMSQVDTEPNPGFLKTAVVCSERGLALNTCAGAVRGGSLSTSVNVHPVVGPVLECFQ